MQACNKITCEAKLFLKAEQVSDYEMLRVLLPSKLDKSLNTQKMIKKHKLEKQSFHEYKFYMRKIAATGIVDMLSLIQRLVNG